jgi:probable phosphoglycerate mutase
MATQYHQRGFALAADATELVLVRHGASAPAVDGQPFQSLHGHGDPPLAPEGELQAEAVARRLAAPAHAPAALFVTGLQRTAQTAAPLAERTGLEAHVVWELREVNLGEWEGGVLRIRVAEGDPLAKRLFDEQRWDVIPGAESMEALAGRVRAGVQQIVDTVGSGAVAVAFVHGGVIGELCRQATASRPFAFIGSDNCSISRLVVLGDGRWVLRCFNDTAHLEAGKAP